MRLVELCVTLYKLLWVCNEIFEITRHLVINYINGKFKSVTTCQSTFHQIHNRGNNMDVGNYRDVSTLHIMSQALEKEMINYVSASFILVYLTLESDIFVKYYCHMYGWKYHMSTW
jgi:predicted translin family RNA/ssDNA-binding protein